MAQEVITYNFFIKYCNQERHCKIKKNITQNDLKDPYNITMLLTIKIISKNPNVIKNILFIYTLN